MNNGPFLMRRLGRRLFWRWPALYRHFGLVRGRGDCFEQDFDLWLGGFPRSANTFACEAFQIANPGARLASHRHVPPFIIRWLDAGRPGIFLIREPEDAVISWTILWGGHLEESLNYYLDFHRALLPHVSRLLVATFEMVTADFGAVTERFNQRFGTHYAAFRHAPAAVTECFSRIDKTSPLSGSELGVCRPSEKRAKMKPKLRQQLRETPALIRKLEMANERYAAFTAAPLGARYPEGCSAEHSPSPSAESRPRRAAGCAAQVDIPLPPSPAPAFAFSLTNCAAVQTMAPTDPRAMMSYFAFRLKRYSLPVLFVGLALLLRLALEPALKGQLTYTFFFAAIVLTAWTSGTAETLCAVLLGFLAAEWFVIAPVKSLTISGAQGWWGTGLYFFVGLGIVWFMKSKQSAGLLALSSAVEARRRLEEVEQQQTRAERIEQSLERLTAIVEAAQYPLISVNPSGVITTWNNAAQALFGYSAQEALGHPLTLLVPPEGERQEEDILATVNSGQPAKPWEAMLICKGGKTVPVWLAVSQLKGRSGKLLGAVIIAHASAS